MEKILHRAGTRGYANHGWLITHHTFSFASYYDPERVHFGTLRVLNDDIIKPEGGFDMHPHDNMEIITIPLEGSLEHRDSMGNGSVIRTHEVQVMSAGTGILHSEFNPSAEEETNLLQIWVFPKVRDIEPRYDQKVFAPDLFSNKLGTIVSSEKGGNSLWINQEAWFSMGYFGKGASLGYPLHREGNGLYIFLISGKAEVAEEVLEPRDGLGLSGISSVSLTFPEDSHLLLMEVPMK